MRKVFPGLAITALVLLVGTAMSVGHYHRPTHEASSSTSKQGQSLPPASDVPVAAAAHLGSGTTMCSQNATGKLLLVSISDQYLWACDGTTIVRESPVTTGASALTNVDDATPTGTWHILRKTTNTHLRGKDANGSWDDDVAYWMPFDGSIGFHDASWQTFPFGSSAYTTQGSHGCVHLPTEVAAWVYGWAPIGTTVTVRA